MPRSTTARPSPFRRFITELVREHGTAGKIADGIDMTLSAFSRGVRNEDTLGTTKLLRLAEFAGVSPVKVLRLANKAEAADAIERLYGQVPPPLGADDRALLALDTPIKQQLLRLVDGLTRPPAKRG